MIRSCYECCFYFWRKCVHKKSILSINWYHYYTASSILEVNAYSY
ncbi:hypothetical protein HMPREF2738_00877 [Clostridiales bacterium KLE1615]|nr:hypothetical protein HMPREF2738_00877 [Clostridiales bacterium KLE1615]